MDGFIGGYEIFDEKLIDLMMIDLNLIFLIDNNFECICFFIFYIFWLLDDDLLEWLYDMIIEL